MDHQKVAFIICANDDLYLEECIHYIERVIVPEGFSTDIIVIKEANSMTEAYNAAMTDSDAKYKVYLHQDVFILNKNLIQDFLDIFQNPNIGMIGVMGTAKTYPRSATFSFYLDIGKILRTDEENCYTDYHYYDNPNNVEAVVAIDGMFMITQYDVPWNEQITGWHFYDASQSIEVQRRGCQVVVPYQEEAWILHDAIICSTKGYEQSRKHFCELYRDIGFVYDKKDVNLFSEWEVFEKKKENIIACLNTNRLKEAQDKFKVLVEMHMDAELSIMKDLFEIWERELKSKKASLIFVGGWQEAKKRYHSIKFLLRRIEWDFPPEESQELIDRVLAKEISSDEIMVICAHNVNIVSVEKVINQISDRCEKI